MGGVAASASSAGDPGVTVSVTPAKARKKSKVYEHICEECLSTWTVDDQHRDWHTDSKNPQCCDKPLKVESDEIDNLACPECFRT